MADEMGVVMVHLHRSPIDGYFADVEFEGGEIQAGVQVCVHLTTPLPEEEVKDGVHERDSSSSEGDEGSGQGRS